MGLDMYLTRKRYIWSDERDKLKIEGINIKTSKVKEITEEVAYWRKANEIHRWFVENIQKGIDDCKEYYVEKEDIEKLLKLVNNTLANKEEAINFLPTISGFFFGNTDYDDWYWERIEETKKILKEVLKEWDDKYSYYYRSSW